MNLLKNTLLIVVLLNASFLQGQTNKINIGLVGGAGIKTLYGNQSLDDHQLSTGFTGGVTLQYNFSKLFSLKSNLSYERKGATQKFQAVDMQGNPIGEQTIHSNFDYLTLPVLGSLTLGKKIHFYVNAGPYLGLLLKQKEVYEAIGEYPQTENDNTAHFKRLDFGVTTGLGVSFPLQEKLLLHVEVSNNLGLINISALPVAYGGSIKTNSTYLLLGIAYRFLTRKE